MSGINTLVDTNIIGTILSDKIFFSKNFSKMTVVGISIITKYEFLSNPDLTLKDKYLFEEYPDTNLSGWYRFYFRQQYYQSVGP